MRVQSCLILFALILPVGRITAQYPVSELRGTVYEVNINGNKPLKNAKIIFIECNNGTCPESENPFTTATSDSLGQFKALMAYRDYKVIVRASGHCDSAVMYSPIVRKPSDKLLRDFYVRRCVK